MQIKTTVSYYFLSSNTWGLRIQWFPVHFNHSHSFPTAQGLIRVLLIACTIAVYWVNSCLSVLLNPILKCYSYQPFRNRLTESIMKKKRYHKIDHLMLWLLNAQFWTSFQSPLSELPLKGWSSGCPWWEAHPCSAVVVTGLVCSQGIVSAQQGFEMVLWI